MTDDTPQPIDPVRKRVNDTIDDLMGRRVVPADRARLRDAVDKADKPQTGRAGADSGVGRAIKGKL